jgi:peptide/nickel transport system permease protein
MGTRFPEADHPPTRIQFAHEGRLQRPFVYGTVKERDSYTLELKFTPDPEARYPIHLFGKGEPYRLWNLIPLERHLLSVEEPGRLFLIGSDDIGRDLMSQVIFGSRISLTIGLVGVTVSFLIGVILGGISGYFGGIVDVIIQRVIEFLISIPTIPLWFALSAALTPDWGVIKTYFAIVCLLSLVGWGGLARVVRGKLLELRELDYVTAARIMGVSVPTNIRFHMLPNFMSYLIVALTLAVPGMILGETALSFLGLGIRAPAVSWGVLLERSGNLNAIQLYPWMVSPVLFVVVTVLAFNFLGDGLRDAADPYK